MNSEVITVGTELLLGHILDTNSVYLSRRLAEAGINLYYRTTVGDNIERLAAVLRLAYERSDLVIITGGLGPTVDDITRDAVAAFTGRKLVLDDGALKKIEEMFRIRNAEMPASNKLQAYLPEGALVMDNRNGTAPGFILEYNSKFIAAMPGVPAEMHAMMENTVIPYILEKAGGAEQVIKSTSLKISGLPESFVNDRIEDLFRKSKNPSVAILAHTAEIEIRLTAKAENADAAGVMIKELKDEMYRRLSENIFGEDEDTLEGKIAEILTGSGLTISAAESCTAGLLSSRLTNVPGSSDYFKGGVNAYSNEVKTGILGVDPAVIDRHGAVSEECAREMALRCAEKFKTDIGVSITGIAGPGGGTAEKPVGLTYIGINKKGSVNVHKYVLPGQRNTIRARAAQTALFRLYREIKD